MRCQFSPAKLTLSLERTSAFGTRVPLALQRSTSRRKAAAHGFCDLSRNIRLIYT
jgi:hypothetical protein